jgi:D-apionolactonase
VTDLSAEIIRTGTWSQPPAVIRLRAGPVRAVFTDGDLRQVCHGDTELARRIYVAIRDLDWNTLPGDLSDLDIDDRGDSFAIRFTRRHKAGDLDFRWHGEIDGDSAGTIRYRMHGTALSAFPYAKIGICVHHPTAGYAGRPYRGSTPDGQVSGTLPDAIGPQIHLGDGTDLPLFEPVSDLDLTHASGGVVAFEFTGDLWEMEDQRNWTDASYKSASTPARLGYHHEAAPGQQLDQHVVIRASGFPAADTTASQADGALTIAIGEADGPAFPPVGLRCAEPGAAWSDRARAVLRAIGPAHLRADVSLASESAGSDLGAAADRARELSCALELAVFLPAGDAAAVGAALGRLRDGLAAARPVLGRVLAFSAEEESSSAGIVAAIRAALAAADEAGVPVISGTNIYFNELNRHRIPPGDADGLAWSVNPQIHAFDDMSLMENLQAQPDTIATARFFAPGTGLYVTPVTLRPRFNAVAVTGQEFPDRGLPWQADVRQPSLFAAAWTLGSIAALAAAGADGLTYYDAVGPAGVIESQDGSPEPAEFFSRPDTPYPLAVVLADACGLAGGRVRRVSGADPALVAAVAVSTGGVGSGGASTDGGSFGAATTILLANLTAATRQIRVSLAGAGLRQARGTARLRVLDEHSFEAAAAGFESFLASAADVPITEGAVTVTLNPYGVARLDVTGA